MFRVPTRISFGRGVALTVAEPLRQVGATKVLLVTDPGVRKVGLTGPIEQVWGRFSRSDVVVGERHGPWSTTCSVVRQSRPRINITGREIRP